MSINRYLSNIGKATDEHKDSMKSAAKWAKKDLQQEDSALKGAAKWADKDLGKKDSKLKGAAKWAKEHPEDVPVPVLCVAYSSMARKSPCSCAGQECCQYVSEILQGE